MTERSLIEAFRRDVLEDTEFVRLVGEASELRDLHGMPSMAWVMADGFFPSPSSMWPMEIDPIALREAWFPEFIPLAGQTPDEPDLRIVDREMVADTLRHGLRLAIDVIEVVERFLHPLRSGKITASGLTAAGIMAPIPPAVWQRPATLIDVRQGEISRQDAETEGDPITREWTAVTLIEAGPLAIKAKPSRPTRDRTPRKDGVEWDYALDQLLFYLNGGGARLRSRADLVRHVLDLLEDRRKAPGENDVRDFFRKYYPGLWDFLKP